MHPSQQILSSTEYTDQTRYKLPTGNQMHGKQKPNSVTVNEYKEGCDWLLYWTSSKIWNVQRRRKKKKRRQRLPIRQNQCFYAHLRDQYHKSFLLTSMFDGWVVAQKSAPHDSTVINKVARRFASDHVPLQGALPWDPRMEFNHPAT